MGRLAFSACLEQEPDALLGFVDPVLEEARRCHVAVLLAKRMGLSHCCSQSLIVVAKLREHVLRGYELRVVVGKTLHPADLADRTDRRAADLARSLGDGIGRSEDLRRLLVEQEMV